MFLPYRNPSNIGSTAGICWGGGGEGEGERWWKVSRGGNSKCTLWVLAGSLGEPRSGHKQLSKATQSLTIGQRSHDAVGHFNAAAVAAAAGLHCHLHRSKSLALVAGCAALCGGTPHTCPPFTWRRPLAGCARRDCLTGSRRPLPLCSSRAGAATAATGAAASLQRGAAWVRWRAWGRAIAVKLSCAAIVVVPGGVWRDSHTRRRDRWGAGDGRRAAGAFNDDGDGSGWVARCAGCLAGCKGSGQVGPAALFKARCLKHANKGKQDLAGPRLNRHSPRHLLGAARAVLQVPHF